MARPWKGQMQTPADLTLQADRIYPTADSNFTINSGGTVTILPSDSHNSSPIYSANGNLTIQAQNIDMEGGELAAPMGQIFVAGQPSGRVYLASGSTVSTAGSIAVDYGTLNTVFWTTMDKANTQDTNGITVPGAPQSSVTITGSEVIMKTGSTVNISGGGSIFAYQFQPGIQGYRSIAGRYVIIVRRYVIVPPSAYSPPQVLPRHAAGLQGVYLKALKACRPVRIPFFPSNMPFCRERWS